MTVDLFEHVHIGLLVVVLMRVRMMIFDLQNHVPTLPVPELTIMRHTGKQLGVCLDQLDPLDGFAVFIDDANERRVKALH
jgi:hypothetical protein